MSAPSSSNQPPTVTKTIPSINIMIFGPPGAGTTTLTHRLANIDPESAPPRNYTHTLERTLSIGNPHPLTITLWDFNSRHIFRSWTCRASVAVLVYDIGDPLSFQALGPILKSLTPIQDKDIINIPIVLIALKCDIDSPRLVSAQDAQQWAKDNNCIDYIELSAKYGLSCEETVEFLARLGLQREIEVMIKNNIDNEFEYESCKNISIQKSHTPTTTDPSSNSSSFGIDTNSTTNVPTTIITTPNTDTVAAMKKFLTASIKNNKHRPGYIKDDVFI